MTLEISDSITQSPGVQAHQNGHPVFLLLFGII